MRMLLAVLVHFREYTGYVKLGLGHVSRHDNSCAYFGGPVVHLLRVCLAKRGCVFCATHQHMNGKVTVVSCASRFPPLCCTSSGRSFRRLIV